MATAELAVLVGGTQALGRRVLRFDGAFLALMEVRAALGRVDDEAAAVSTKGYKGNSFS